MTSVGVRELRQRASELLRLVGEGETIEITDRGRPVALLGPLPQGSPLDVNEAILNAAGALLPADLRSLDAIHLATARQLGNELGQVITYDGRMASAARLLRLKVATPR